ncbi:hypothetical protein [Liquorilactobacillus hordei]|uniref:Glutaredoxin domain-containing protein n=1 Tax=Liquorilactobacillus hordei DSM 19519 TaxID=1423759 RepID=A0A0R1MJ13_9LACO|nr:hypothetical protein [Liquorilactobacillus hordei]KRL07964.1 hypothetical protein FC92_GL001032 [Liquorilactobacillus hordei DSM 19519]QYH51092.1 hypothetical protein G6O70_00590 [Liquorilactobacillus hordei DSM 19519]
MSEGYNAKVYWKDGCSRCKQTMNLFKIPFESVKASQEFIEYLKEEKEVRSMPYVEIFDKDRRIVDSWSNFEYDKIREWNKKIDA